MGKRVYLNDQELTVISEALTKWENWAAGNMEPWEDETLDGLINKGVYLDAEE